jgi:hypothetical protein
MKTRRTLIRSPLEWQLTAATLPHPAIPVLAERGGTQLKTPPPVILVDTREQTPFDFSRFEGWFSGIEKKPLQLGDYSVAGLEDVCVVERKDLPDLIRSLTADRSIFVDRLRRMSRYPHRLLVSRPGDFVNTDSLPRISVSPTERPSRFGISANVGA